MPAPIMCKRVIALEDPVYGVDSRYGGPEYETIAALGSNLNIIDLEGCRQGQRKSAIATAWTPFRPA